MGKTRRRDDPGQPKVDPQTKYKDALRAARKAARRVKDPDLRQIAEQRLLEQGLQGLKDELFFNDLK